MRMAEVMIDVQTARMKKKRKGAIMRPRRGTVWVAESSERRRAKNKKLLSSGGGVVPVTLSAEKQEEIAVATMDELVPRFGELLRVF